MTLLSRAPAVMMLAMVSLVAGVTALTTPVTSTEQKEAPKQTTPDAKSQTQDQANAPLALQFVDTQRLSLRLKGAEPQAVTTVYVSNGDKEYDANTLAFIARLQDEEGRSYLLTEGGPQKDKDATGVLTKSRIAIVPAPEKPAPDKEVVKKNSVATYQLTFKPNGALPRFGGSDDNVGQPLSGYLMITTTDAIAGRVPLTLLPPTPSSFAAWPVTRGLLIAFLIVVFSAFVIRDKLPDRLGLVEWNPTGSWATNLTALGAILAAVIASTLLPAQTYHMQKNEYGILALLFTVLAGLAPLIYNSLRVSPKPGGNEPEGKMSMFLLSTLVTIWGVYGQLITLIFLIDEFRVTKLMPDWAVLLFLGLLGVVGVLMAIYCYRTIRSTAELAEPEPEEAPGEEGDEEAVLTGGESLPKWALL